MITNKQRAKLKSFASLIKPTVQIGKNGITNELIESLKKVLMSHELVKCKVLDNAPINLKETTKELADSVNADIVQIIGNNFVLYRKNPKKKDGIDI